MHSFTLRRSADTGFRISSRAATILVSSFVSFILIFVFRESIPVMSQLQWNDVLVRDDWFPLEGKFGMAGMLLSTIFASLGATLVAAPFGIASAVFMVFVAPRWAVLIMNLLLALMAGTPSVVFGLWGLSVLVPFIGENKPPGTSLLAAIGVLSMMLLPTVALTSVTALKALPRSIHQASFALGFSMPRHVYSVALPAAHSGIRSGVVLAVARALGETMAVLMVAGNVPNLPSSIFEPVRVLTANIALEMGYATGTHRASLFASGFLLVLVVLFISIVANYSRKAEPR